MIFAVPHRRMTPYYIIFRMPQRARNSGSDVLVDREIGRFFARAVGEAGRIDPAYVRLWETLRDVWGAGGKRLRSRITILAYRAYGGTDMPAIVPVAASQELLHFSMLIHDDIIDRDYIRHGVPNVAGRHHSVYDGHAGSADDQLHYAHSAALLGGDLMLAAAHQLITESGLAPANKAAALSLLSRGIFEVVGGELLDTELSFMPYNPGDALKVARYKTASYSFVMPLVMGATLAGADVPAAHPLRAYAAALGVAYQLVDDILGVFGDEAATGKTVSGDIVEGKRTYMVERALALLSPRDAAVLLRTLGNPAATTGEIAEVRRLLETSGARAETERYIGLCANDAHAALDKLELTPAYRQKFTELIGTVTNRAA